MAEPARRYNPEIEPDIRPHLGVVQGGGESTPRRGNLSSVPNDTAHDLQNKESAANSNVYDIGSGRKIAPEDAAERNSDTVRDGENNPNANWATKLSADRKQKDAKAKSNKKKKTLAIVGVGGVAGGILAAFFFLLPLKLEAFYENILKHAEAVPEQAIENRADYLIPRVIAARAAQTAGLSDADLIFCGKGGGIACSLYKTYSTNLIEKKYGLKMTDEPGKPGVIDFKTTKSSGLGGNGYEWKATYKEVDVNGIENVYSKTFSTNAEAKSFVKDFVKERMPSEGGVYDRMKGVVTRYIARKVEMKKFGITRWRGFQKVAEKITDLKSSFGSMIIRNTAGLVSDRFGVAVACFLTSPQTCAKTIENLSPDSETAQKLLGESSDQVVSGAEKLSSEQVANIIATLMESTAAQTASKAIPILGWALLYDMYAHMVLALNDGTVDKLVSDTVEGVYIAYTYGNDVGIVTNLDKLKAGDLDMDTLSVMSDMFNGAEKSPLYAAENGVSNTAMATMFGGSAYAASTASGSSDNGVKCPAFFGTGTTGIPSGDMVCPNQKIDRNITGFLHGSNPIAVNFQATQVPPAKVWVASLGHIAGGINWLISEIGSGSLKVIELIPGIKDAVGAITSALGDIGSDVGKFAETLAGEFLNGVFGMPPVGITATGDQNYTALSGGMRAEANETMQNGQDADGTPDGGGGQYLTPDQTQSVVDNYNASQPKPSYLASLFSPDIEGSLTQQFALMMPTSSTDIISSILNTPSAILASLSHPTFAADSSVSSATANNPFNLAPYGYPVNDPAFTANPDTYTAAYCQQSAAEREASLSQVPGVSYKVYTKSDPCALEKTVVGSLLVDAGNTTDPNSLKDPAPVDGSGDTSTPAPTTGSGNLPSGTSQSLAQQILPYISKGQLTCQLGQGSNCKDIQSTAKNIPLGGSCPSNVRLAVPLLQIILGELQSGDSFAINAMCSDHPATSYGAGATISLHNLGRAMDIGTENGTRLWPNQAEATAGIKKFNTDLTKLVGNPDNPAVNLTMNQGQCDGHGGLSMLNGYHVINTDYCDHQHLGVDNTYWSYDQKFTFPGSGIDAQPASPSGSWYGNARL